MTRWPCSQGWLWALGLTLLAGCAANDELVQVVDQSELVLEDNYQRGDQPEEPGAMFSACASSRDCLPQEYCVHLPDAVGFCSSSCDPEGTLDECDDPPGDQEPACFLVGVLTDGPVVCGLDCVNTPCPNDMKCELVQSGTVQRRMCF